MNEQNQVVNVSYANILASFSEENENCVTSLENETFDTEFVKLDDLSIVTSAPQMSGRISSRIITSDMVANSKVLDIDPEELMNENCQIEDESLSSRHTLFTQSKPSKWKGLVHMDFTKKKKIYSKKDSKTNSLNVFPHTESNINNFIINAIHRLPFQSVHNSAVEQPNIGPCSCFICGIILIEPCEKFSYLKSQKLFNMKVSLLQLLGHIINQTVLTDTDSIDLCLKCSEIMNEADITYKYLKDLKEKITKLFALNKRPKLTFQVLPRPSSLMAKNSILKSNEINLSELACSRPRRNRSMKKKTENMNNKSDKTVETGKPLKRKGGRPRKPFQCHVCKRKFLTQSQNEKHLLKEHYISNNSNSSQFHPLSTAVSSNTVTVNNSANSNFHNNTSMASTKSVVVNNTTLSENSGKIVKEENIDEEKYDKSENQNKEVQTSKCSVLMHEQPEAYSFTKVSVGLNNSVTHTSVRPIQPKPQMLVQTAVDGSLVYIMNPTKSDASPTLIKVSPGYFSLKTGSYMCEVCQKSFLDDKGYKMHKIAAHGIRKRKLDFVNNDNITLYNDDKKEYSHKIWSCEMCNLTFASKKIMSDHKRLTHQNFRKSISRDSKKEKLYSCDDCNQLFSFKYELENHREIHIPFSQIGPHEFVCCLCGLKVASKAALKIHFQRFHNKNEETKNFLCSECGYMTSTKKSFSDHLRIHSENPDQKKVCHLCKKEMLPSSYKIHMLRMHGEAKHPCDMCGQRFPVRSDLMKHLNTVHSTLKPYDCNICGEKFVTSETLRYHKNKIHSSVFHFCEICGKSYKWKGELRTHINRCHNEAKTRYQCTTCQRSFVDRKKLHHHMVMKHKADKEIPYVRKQCEEEPDPLKLTSTVPSSSYEPENNLLQSTHHNVMTSIPCSPNETSIHMITEDNLASLPDYNSDHHTGTLTTLHSQVPLHEDLHRPLDRQDSSNPLTHFHETQIEVSASAEDVLAHQSINTSLVPMETKVQHLTPQQVHSLYLVSDMQMTIPDKSVSS